MNWRTKPNWSFVEHMGVAQPVKEGRRMEVGQRWCWEAPRTAKTTLECPWMRWMASHAFFCTGGMTGCWMVLTRRILAPKTRRMCQYHLGRPSSEMHHYLPCWTEAARQ